MQKACLHLRSFNSCGRMLFILCWPYDSDAYGPIPCWRIRGTGCTRSAVHSCIFAGHGRSLLQWKNIGWDFSCRRLSYGSEAPLHSPTERIPLCVCPELFDLDYVLKLSMTLCFNIGLHAMLCLWAILFRCGYCLEYLNIEIYSLSLLLSLCLSSCWVESCLL